MTNVQVPRQAVHPAPAAPTPPRETAATRHLCAGAYLDEAFQRASLREAYDQARRVVAPSYGFSLIPVLWHCLRARKATIARDSTIVGLLVISACLFGLTLIFVIGYLLQLHVLVTLGRMVRDSVSAVRANDSIAIGTILSHGLRLIGGLLVLCLLWAVFWFYFVAASFTGDGGGFLLILVLATLLALGVVATPVTVNLWQQYQIKQFVPGGSVGHPPMSARFDDIYRQQQGNTVVYSGYRPFVGSGDVVDTWGLAQRLVRPTTPVDGRAGAAREGEREFDQVPFTAQDIIGYVAGELRVLINDPSPERRLPGLEVEDRVFLAGTEVDHLSVVTGPARMAHVIQFPTTPARYYLSCQVVSWDGELVTTVYVHFAVQGRSLYLEVTTTALPPCDERYRIIDQVDGTGAAATLRALGRGVADAPRLAAAAPINLVRALVEAIASGRTANPAGPVARGLDYGARVSVRELGASAMTRNHVQTQDVLKYKRIIERRVVASVLDFLESRGVETTEYRQRALTILNVGAVNSGGGTMVVGTAVGAREDR